jgi:hypothetical protein
MYLAKLLDGCETIYQIRQSYQTAASTFTYRIVFTLGSNPGRFIEPFADDIVLFHNDLVVSVAALTKDDAESVLERLLWDFLPQATQQKLALFRGRGDHRGGRLTSEDRQKIDHQIHLFDRRRLYYLRYGAVDQSRLSRLHETCCRPLLGQSRDEREYWFTAEESALAPGHYLQYVYAIFNLQQYFHQSFAPWLPESLALDEMGEHFEKELCRLNRDCRFWQKENITDSLHHHLIRYLLMFFDYTPTRRSFLDDFARTFMAGHRTFRWPEKKSARSAAKISEVFATSNEELKKMSRQQLSRLYRQKAMQLHPDRGGDHELFIELTEIYNDLLRTK